MKQSSTLLSVDLNKATVQPWVSLDLSSLLLSTTSSNVKFNFRITLSCCSFCLPLSKSWTVVSSKLRAFCYWSQMFYDVQCSESPSQVSEPVFIFDRFSRALSLARGRAVHEKPIRSQFAKICQSTKKWQSNDRSDKSGRFFQFSGDQRERTVQLHSGRYCIHWVIFRICFTCQNESSGGCDVKSEMTLRLTCGLKNQGHGRASSGQRQSMISIMGQALSDWLTVTEALACNAIAWIGYSWLTTDWSADA